MIASNVGGLPELVRDGQTGLLVPPGDPVALAGAAQRLCAEPMLRTRLADAGHAFALQHLSLHRKMEESLAIYAGVATPRRPKPRPRTARQGNVVPFPLSRSPSLLKTAVRAAGIAAALLVGWLNLATDWNPVAPAPQPLSNAAQLRADFQARIERLAGHDRFVQLDEDDGVDDLLLPDDDDLA